MKVLCVIPARYASTRLPGKPLKLIAGKPMIQHVYEQAKKAKNRPKSWSPSMTSASTTPSPGSAARPS